MPLPNCKIIKCCEMNQKYYRPYLVRVVGRDSCQQSRGDFLQTGGGEGAESCCRAGVRGCRAALGGHWPIARERRLRSTGASCPMNSLFRSVFLRTCALSDLKDLKV